MTKIKFVHTADLHLDTPFKKLSNWNVELASKLKQSTFDSLEKIVDLCLEEEVNFLIISGDIFDSENQSLIAQSKFFDELQRLSDKDIYTYFVCGNHDPLDSWLDVHQMPDKVFRFGGSTVENKTYSKNNTRLADIYGISYKQKVVDSNLALGFQLKDQPAPISIAVLHGTIGTSEQHENYAPFSTGDINNKGFDYWALGHIHKRNIVQIEHPTIVYPGNPQGRDFGEKGIRGCYLVEIEAGNNPTLDFRPIQTIRHEEILIDMSEIETIDVLNGQIKNPQAYIKDYQQSVNYRLRIILQGKTELHSYLTQKGELDELVNYYNEGQLKEPYFIWIDKITLKTQPEIDVEKVRGGTSFASELLQMIENYENSPEKLDTLISAVSDDFDSPNAQRELTNLTGKEKEDILEMAKWNLLEMLLEK